MSRILNCDSCGQAIKVPARQQVLSVTCPKCSQTFDVFPETELSLAAGSSGSAPAAVPSNAVLPLLTAIGIAGMLLMLCALGWTFAQLRSGSSATPQINVREQMKAAMSEKLNAHKQELLEQIHPIGTAKNVVVHDFDFVSGSAGEMHVVYRFTLYWAGPIEKDGFTKIQSTFDPESKRQVQTQILATNGVTHAEFQAAAFELGRFLGEAIRAEQQQQAMQRRQGS